MKISCINRSLTPIFVEPSLTNDRNIVHEDNRVAMCDYAKTVEVN